MSLLFTESKIGNLTLKNRIVRSATWEALADVHGHIDERTYDLYEELAKGGTGLIITGFTSVDADDHYFKGMMRLSDDALIPEYRKLTDLIHKENAAVFAQLALGAYYKNGIQTEPDEMTSEDIGKVKQMFMNAAVRARKAGFDGIQIHIAHFFFLSRFVSSAINHRTDSYGGNIENRTRIILELMKQIRTECPDLLISAKVNSSDFTYGGNDEEDCLEMCRLLDEAGIDAIEISGNGTSVSGIRAHVNEGYFVPAAMKIAENTECPLICVGGFRSADVMEAVLEKTKIQFISLSRPLLREPDLPLKMSQDSSYISKCVSCNACYSSYAHQCVFRKKNQK